MRLRGVRPGSLSTTILRRDGIRLLAAGLLATLLTGCAVPLGPGFRLRSRQMVLGTTPSASVHVQVTDRMENTGNRPLTYLDVVLPTAVDLKRSNLMARIDGEAITPVADSADPAAPFRLPFDAPWPPKQRREITLEYDLVSDPLSGGVAAVMPQGFYLADPHALPVWPTPVGFFASSDVLRRDERFELTLPADFRVVGSGRQQRKRLDDGRVLYRFRTSGKELPSFVIAGRYQEQRVKTDNRDVLFWTFQPLDPAIAQKVAERLTTTASTFTRFFGPLSKPGALRLIEAPAGLLSAETDVPGQPATAVAFPQGLLLGPRAFSEGLASEAVLQVAEAELARIWFGWRLPLRSDVDTLLGRGLGRFAVTLAAEARSGAPVRHSEIARLLAEYDRARIPGDEGSLLRPPEQSTPPQLVANSLKAALFLADLEDRTGQEKFEEAIRRLQLAIAGRGLTLSLDDLRSSLETSSGMPMADVFRLWLNHPGVPDEFRERYESGAAALAPEKTGVAAQFRRQP